MRKTRRTLRSAECDVSLLRMKLHLDLNKYVHNFVILLYLCTLMKLTIT
jgi:hypothetical protein